MDHQDMVIKEALEAKTQNPDGKTLVQSCGVFGLSDKSTVFGNGVGEVGEPSRDRESGGRGNVSLVSGFGGLDGGSDRCEEVSLVNGMDYDVIDSMEDVRGENAAVSVGFSGLGSGPVPGEEVCLVNEMDYAAIDGMESDRGENVVLGGYDVREFGNNVTDFGVEEKCWLPSDEFEGKRGEDMVYVGSTIDGMFGHDDRDESRVDKVLEKGVKGEDPERYGADFGENVDIPRDGISLYVDISCEANRTGNAIHEIVRSDEITANKGQMDNLECGFSVGDIVWVRTKNKAWWPGKVGDRRIVSICDTKADRISSLLVSFYGSGHASWCNTSQLKPFHDDFELLSRKNKSRSFVAAVKRAVNEFGTNVKLDITSCFLKGGQLPETGSRAGLILPAPERRSGTLNYLVNQLEPKRFLEHVRSLALISVVHGMLNTTIMQNSLAAFYQFMGHRQLTVNQLQDKLDEKCEASEEAVTNCRNVSSGLDSKRRKRRSTKNFQGESSLEKPRVAETGLLATSSKERTGLMESKKSESKSVGPGEKNIGMEGESRGRKKSKYLSYPYVNWDKSSPSKTEETDTQKSEGGEKTFRRAKKFDKSSSAEIKNLNGSSAEMLAQLKDAAVSIPYHKEYINFDSTKWFYLKFRNSVYNNDKSMGEDNMKSTIGQNEGKRSESPINIPAKSNPENEKVMSECAEATSLPSENGAAGELPGSFLKDLLEVSHNAPTIDHKTQIKQEGEEQTRLKIKPISGISDININMDTSGLFRKQMSSVTAHGKPVMERRKKNEEATCPQMSTKQMPGIPDLNGDNSITFGVVRDINTNHAGPSFSSVNLQLNCTTALEANQEKKSGIEFTTREPNCSSSSGKSGLLIDVQPVVGTLTPEPVRRRKRRSKKDIAASDSSKASLIPGIPDLNGTSTESASPGKKLPEINLVSLEGKAEPKKRKREKFQPTDLGTSLLLKFAPGTVIPSREVLEATFWRFGPLKKSETQLCKDSDTVEVPFLGTSDALEAFRSLEKYNPFGATLVNYRLHQHSAASTASGPDKSQQRSRACLPIGGFLAPVNPSVVKLASAEAPPLHVIKQNLEMMTFMLEKSGSSLSPDMRNNLEREIKGLLAKVSGMSGPSS